MPACTLIPISWLAAIPNSVSRLNIRSLVDCLPVNFNPGMGLKRKFLCAQDHVCGHAALPEQIRSDKGALQAKSLFWIPDAGVVNRCADPINSVRMGSSGRSHLPPFDYQVEGIEAANGAQNIV